MNFITKITLVFIFILIFSCSDEKSIKEVAKYECTMKETNDRIEELSNSVEFLKSSFYLSQTEIDSFKQGLLKSGKQTREEIILKFVSRLSDLSPIYTDWKPKFNDHLKMSDLSIYCIAKAESFPTYTAIGVQNCTNGLISESVLLPTNFTCFSDRNLITFKYLKYFRSEYRQEFLKEYGYDQ